MSPLLFLAIAIVVPLLGMAVLGVGARLKSQRVTDDETEPFRRRLASIAPRSSGRRSSGTPGLVQMMRRLTGARGADPADASDAAVEAAAANAGTRGAADSAASRGAAARDAAGGAASRSTATGGAADGGLAGGAASDAGTAGNDGGRRHRRGRRRQRTQRPETTTIGVVRPKATTASVRLIEREYSLPLLPPFSAELDDPAWQRRDARTHAPARRPEARQPPAQTTEPPASATQRPASSTQRPANSSQPPSSSTQSSSSSTQSSSSSTQSPASSSQPPASSTQPGFGSAQSPAHAAQPRVGSARSLADTTQPSPRSARSPTSSIRLLPAQGSGRDQDQNRRPVSSPAADDRPGAVRRDAVRPGAVRGGAVRPGAVRRDADLRVTSTVGAALTAPTAPEPPQAAPQFKGTVRLVEIQTPIVPPRNERVTSRNQRRRPGS